MYTDVHNMYISQLPPAVFPTTPLWIIQLAAAGNKKKKKKPPPLSIKCLMQSLAELVLNTSFELHLVLFVENVKKDQAIKWFPRKIYHFLNYKIPPMHVH